VIRPEYFANTTIKIDLNEISDNRHYYLIFYENYLDVVYYQPSQSRIVLRRSEEKDEKIAASKIDQRKRKKPIHVVNVLFCIIMIINIFKDVDEVIHYYYY